MRRRGGQYGSDTGGSNPYGSTATSSHHHHHQPQREQQHQQFNKAEHHKQWRWERDVGTKLSSPISPHIVNQDLGNDASRSYHHGQRPDPKMPIEKHRNSDARSQHREEDMDIGYEDNAISRTFEGLEQKFMDDIMKLSKEQSDAEDAENARHRERINAINMQYQEQLVALRSRHAKHRDEVLLKESQARHQQYQQAALDSYPGRGNLGTRDPHGYNAVAAPAAEPHRTYTPDDYDGYRERARYFGNPREYGFEPRVPFPGGRVYDPGSRYH